MNMLSPVNVKAFNSMQSKIADAYVDISKLSMTEAAEVLRLNSIYEYENLKIRKLMFLEISQKFNMVKKVLTVCNFMTYCTVTE